MDDAEVEQKKNVVYLGPPSMYYRDQMSPPKKNIITDFAYKGNHLDVEHLSTKRMGPTAHLSQI